MHTHGKSFGTFFLEVTVLELFFTVKFTNLKYMYYVMILVNLGNVDKVVM